MKIIDIVCSGGRTGFYFDDQRAIKGGAGHDGVFYVGAPVTEGFRSVRQAGESISVMIILEDGQIAFGDCAAVQYSGAGGRDPLFLAEEFIPIIDKYIKPELVGKEADNFRELAKMMEAIQVEGKRLHTAIRYGMSQAILDAVAKATGRLMCEVVADEYGCEVSEDPIAIFTQSGDDRYSGADKMIIKGAQVLPHALINNVEDKLGRNEVGGQAVLGRQVKVTTPWLTERHGYDPTYLSLTVAVAVHGAFDAQVEGLCQLAQLFDVIGHILVVVVAEYLADGAVAIDVQHGGIVLEEAMLLDAVAQPLYIIGELFAVLAQLVLDVVDQSMGQNLCALNDHLVCAGVAVITGLGEDKSDRSHVVL